MKTVTAILLGAGQRGVDACAAYAKKYPNELKIVGVAEPRQERRKAFARAHGICEENSVSSWEELLNRPKMADCVFICTQDKMHYEPLKKAAGLGYHILCEKPVSPDKDELLAIRSLAEQYDGVISVAHVLRYSPFFTKIKELLDAGKIGRLLNIQHMEAVGYWHMAHSFVRGNWRDSHETSPMILAKCCHDFDILLFLAGMAVQRVSSFGSLTLFKEENAPADAPMRCLDGCSHRDECPFYAPRFYLEHPKAVSDGFRRVLSLDETQEAVLEALRESPYGRCVYRCDNDVVDHQVVNLEFEGGLTASLTMCAFTDRCERVISLHGSHGEIRGWMEDNRIEVVDFATENREIIHVHAPKTGHGGSDMAMMKRFVQMTAGEKHEKNISSAVEAVDSHLIALAAEKSRKSGGCVVEMRTFGEE
jgi:predicted dehydrogenase